MTGDAPRILLVEDDDDHAELLFRAFALSGGAEAVGRVSDGETALDYMFRRGQWADPALSPRPHLILLDLRLPRMDGIEVLRNLKQSEDLRHFPVVVLTTSHAERDVAAAYRNHANSYLVKPVNFEKLTVMIEAIGLYWLRWNRNQSDDRN